MCIRYCDDGDSRGVGDIMAALELGVAVDDIFSYLEYDSDELVELIGSGGNRDDTLEYLRWFPQMWISTQLHQYNAFCEIYDAITALTNQ